jgi:hypothetical protein
MQICAECHHGKGIRKVKCEDCHIDMKRFIQRKENAGVKERPSNKIDVVECEVCWSKRRIALMR